MLLVVYHCIDMDFPPISVEDLTQKHQVPRKHGVTPGGTDKSPYSNLAVAICPTARNATNHGTPESTWRRYLATSTIKLYGGRLVRTTGLLV